MKRDINTRALAHAKQLRTFSGAAYTDGRGDLASILQNAAAQIEQEVKEADQPQAAE